jgi:transposase
MTGTEPHAWETGLMDTITYVGLDVHKATVAVAVAEGGRGGEVRQLGVFENRSEILTKLAARLSKPGRCLSFCYEAGPCGYGLHRLLTGGGHDCVVVAPSLIPVKAGDRVKTDRRDALMLAKLHRAGELTPIWIPDAAHEAMRDLVRARATAGRVLSKARQHLQSFLLRHDQIYRGARAWTLAYRRWLTTVRFAHPAQQIVLQDYIHAVQDAEARLDRLTRQIEELLPSWAMAPVVAALQAMRKPCQRGQCGLDVGPGRAADQLLPTDTAVALLGERPRQGHNGLHHRVVAPSQRPERSAKSSRSTNNLL